MDNKFKLKGKKLNVPPGTLIACIFPFYKENGNTYSHLPTIDCYVDDSGQCHLFKGEKVALEQMKSLSLSYYDEQTLQELQELYQTIEKIQLKLKMTQNLQPSKTPNKRKI